MLRQRSAQALRGSEEEARPWGARKGFTDQGMPSGTLERLRVGQAGGRRGDKGLQSPEAGEGNWVWGEGGGAGRGGA